MKLYLFFIVFSYSMMFIYTNLLVQDEALLKTSINVADDIYIKLKDIYDKIKELDVDIKVVTDALVNVTMLATKTLVTVRNR